MAMETRYEMPMNNAKNYQKRFQELRKKDPEKAKKEAIKELIKMGLAKENGDPKETIVSWE